MSDDDRLRILERRARVGELGAGIGHEVRNVLTAVLGFAQVAERRVDDPAEVAKLLGVIGRETGRALEILESFLAVGRLAQDARTVDVNQLVAGAAQLVRHAFLMSQIEVVIELDAAAGVVKGDPGALRQALLNLAFNAAQAMPDGGAVRITTKREGEAAVIRVADDGAGIPAELHDQIFAAFFTTRRGGTGLGLSVSAAIVSEHGGTLALEPSERGAVFAVRLPVEIARPLTVAAIEASR